MSSQKETAGSNRRLASYFKAEDQRLELQDGAKVGVVGGGPAGSFFAYFLLKMAESYGLEVAVDIYEPRSFDRVGPAGCNHCGGIVSESLIQLLAAEGINLPSSIVQRGIDSYMLHMDVGDVGIATPQREARIAGVYRGNGPRDSKRVDVAGFDRYLLELACSTGSTLVRKIVNRISFDLDKPRLLTPDGTTATYDLVAVATGINSQAVNLFQESVPGYRCPKTLRTFICEFQLGQDEIEKCFGKSMHVFLLDLPRLEFAAIIPKDDYATLCLLGDNVDEQLVDSFFEAPEVRASFPDAVVPRPSCHCFPRVNIQSATRPFADHIVWIGDSGTARLYKDGIGSAYRTAKAAANTAVFQGISADAFEQYFWPKCKQIDSDNSMAKIIFAATSVIQKARFLRRAVLRMTAMEQSRRDRRKHMSSVLWDVFTGSAPYKEILLRTFHPGFILLLLWNLVVGNLPFVRTRRLHGEAYES